MKNFLKRIFVLLLVGVSFMPARAFAQTDIRISGAQSSFPIAVSQLCDAGGAGDVSSKIAAIISKDLQISGLFKVLDPASFVEQAGKCSAPDKVAYPDWSVIGAEGLVKGEIKQVGAALEVRMYLHDVLQQKAVVGKRYEAEAGEFSKIAHKFSNEIVRYFTGEAGIFGTRLAYVARMGRFKELFIMDLDGSNIKQLTQDHGLAMSPSWSHSGDKIIYTSYKTRKPELYTISPEGGVGKQLTERQGLEIGAKFSPNDSSIITSAAISGISKIAILDLSGRLLKKLTSSDSIDVSPTYSPDGSRIAFCSNRGGGPQIYIMSASGEPATRISYTNSSYCTSPAWSPKGDKIVFVCRSGGNQLFISSPDGGKPTQLTYAGDNEDPNWSPDGRFIAFSSNSSGGARSIAVLSLLGGSPTKIGSPHSEESQPAWSPLAE